MQLYFIRSTGGFIFGVVFFAVCVIGVGIVVWMSRKDEQQSDTAMDKNDCDVGQVIIDMPDLEGGSGSPTKETTQTGIKEDIPENKNNVETVSVINAEIHATEANCYAR